MNPSNGDRPPILPPIPLGLLFAFLIVLVCAAGGSMWVATTRADAGQPPPDATSSLAVSPPRRADPAPTTAVPVALPPTTVETPAPVTKASPPAAPTGCAAALQYLSANAAPGFLLTCPGNAEGHQGLTCIGTAPCAPDQHMIVIADPCPAAYMNEAHNSWVLLHDTSGTAIPGGSTAIDPFGHC